MPASNHGRMTPMNQQEAKQAVARHTQILKQYSELPDPKTAEGREHLARKTRERENKLAEARAALDTSPALGQGSR